MSRRDFLKNLGFKTASAIAINKLQTPKQMNLSKDTLELIYELVRRNSSKTSHSESLIQTKVQAVKEALTNPDILASAGLVRNDEWDKVSRVEVIDEKGRSYVKYLDGKVEQSLQDDGRTLKILITPKQ